MPKLKRKKKVKKSPVWKGPEVDGITFSLLSRFLVCRERFRLLVVEGIRPAKTFNHSIEYGQMWHTCEETFSTGNDWNPDLREYSIYLCRKYPTQQEQVEHWYNVCRVQFPIYVDYWKKNKDVTKRKPVEQEQVFSVPYKLPSGRTVILKGKRDGVDQIGRDGKYLTEHKTKGDIREEIIKRQLSFDLQTMLYMIAYQEEKGESLKGVRYNVVRRPLSGGEGTIKRHKPTQGTKCNLKSCKEHPSVDCNKCKGTGRVGAKPEETKEHFYNRVSDIIEAKPETYFMRWKCEVSEEEVETFRIQCLNPVLEQLCNWYGWITSFDPAPEEYGYGVHYRYPFGVYNPMNEGRASELDEYLTTGSTLGLEKVESLFEEL